MTAMESYIGLELIRERRIIGTIHLEEV